MKEKFLVMAYEGNSSHEVKRFNTYEEAEAHIKKTPADLMGTAEFFIKKIWTNKRE